MRIFPFRFPFWLLFLSYILAVKVLHDHMSFQKDFIFSVRLLSDRFLINVDHLFSMLLLTLFCCQPLLCLYASCRINFLMLINLPSDFSKQHRVCLLGGLASRFKYKVNWQYGLSFKYKKIWCIACDG